MEMPIFSLRLQWWVLLVNLVICISSQTLESLSSTPTFGNETDKLALLTIKNYLVDVQMESLPAQHILLSLADRNAGIFVFGTNLLIHQCDERSPFAEPWDLTNLSIQLLPLKSYDASSFRGTSDHCIPSALAQRNQHFLDGNSRSSHSLHS
ncbi:hypothetical protein CK203_060704 [Vitis vinifera]|uniref:Uncharacterized protein n=1 Tax=Vitis vinifera TaxID=29760 RepID=A0A438GCH6_VITVI|nr:hypothetical protein CK203_060704 [Vitis vinifera]